MLHRLTIHLCPFPGRLFRILPKAIRTIDDGDTAPDFTLPVTRGTDPAELAELRLSETLEDGPVVLAFYPAAFTRGCRKGMCTFRDGLGAFRPHLCLSSPWA